MLPPLSREEFEQNYSINAQMSITYIKDRRTVCGRTYLDPKIAEAYRWYTFGRVDGVMSTMSKLENRNA